MSPPTILLADDHAIVREELVRLLEEADFDVVAAVGDGHRLRDAAIHLRPDVIVTDLSMPGLSVVDVLAQMKAERPDSKVVVLTMHADVDLAVWTIGAGASGYVLKNEAANELAKAIRDVLRSRIYVTPTLRQQVIERMAPFLDALTGSAPAPLR